MATFVIRILRPITTYMQIPLLDIVGGILEIGGGGLGSTVVLFFIYALRHRGEQTNPRSSGRHIPQITNILRTLRPSRVYRQKILLLYPLFLFYIAPVPPTRLGRRDGGVNSSAQIFQVVNITIHFSHSTTILPSFLSSHYAKQPRQIAAEKSQTP